MSSIEVSSARSELCALPFRMLTRRTVGLSPRDCEFPHGYVSGLTTSYSMSHRELTLSQTQNHAQKIPFGIFLPHPQLHLSLQTFSVFRDRRMKRRVCRPHEELNTVYMLIPLQVGPANRPRSPDLLLSPLLSTHLQYHFRHLHYRIQDEKHNQACSYEDVR